MRTSKPFQTRPVDSHCTYLLQRLFHSSRNCCCSFANVMCNSVEHLIYDRRRAILGFSVWYILHKFHKNERYSSVCWPIGQIDYPSARVVLWALDGALFQFEFDDVLKNWLVIIIEKPISYDDCLITHTDTWHIITCSVFSCIILHVLVGCLVGWFVGRWTFGTTVSFILNFWQI